MILGVEFACEVAYPVGEAYSNGMIQIFGNVTGILFSYFLPMLLKKTSKPRSILLMGIVLLLSTICFILLLFMKKTLNRTEAELKV